MCLNIRLIVELYVVVGLMTDSIWFWGCITGWLVLGIR